MPRIGRRSVFDSEVDARKIAAAWAMDEHRRFVVVQRKRKAKAKTLPNSNAFLVLPAEQDQNYGKVIAEYGKKS